MKSWFFPDGFVGDDPSSKRNARWLGLYAICILLITVPALAHAPDRPDLDSWFAGLKSETGGFCCSLADGETVTDAQWDTKDGHYRVFLDDKWWDVADDKVVKVPNKYGPAIVWPLRYSGKVYGIRCFLAGADT